MKILKTLADGGVRVSDHCQITGKSPYVYQDGGRM